MEIRFVGQQIFHLRFISKGSEFNRIPRLISRQLMKYCHPERHETARSAPNRSRASRCANIYYGRRDVIFFSLPQRVALIAPSVLDRGPLRTHALPKVFTKVTDSFFSFVTDKIAAACVCRGSKSTCSPTSGTC